MSRALATCALLGAAALLAACTTADVLEPGAVGGASPAETTAPADVAAPIPQPGAPPAVAGLQTRARIQFAPIVGATVESATPLTERLALKARERGITLARSDEPGTTHVMKGYFSAITEGRKTTVIYVWDVLDPSGNRLHRIQGQTSVASGSASGWAAVPPDTMQQIADGTIDQLVAWLANPGG